MVESLVDFFINTLGGLNGYVVVFIISLMPILELRGGLIAAALLKLNPILSFIICFIGNLTNFTLYYMLIVKIKLLC